MHLDEFYHMVDGFGQKNIYGLSKRQQTPIFYIKVGKRYPNAHFFPMLQYVTF